MNYRSGTLTVVALALALLPALPGMAKGVTKLKEERPGLAKLATISLKDARATAMAKVPKGVIKAQEIEEEGGKLLYSFDLKVNGKSGIEEVNVDAKTGDLVNLEHENAAAEVKEKAADKIEAKQDAKEKGDAAESKTMKTATEKEEK